MDYFTEVLDLTEDQEKQLQGIREELIAEAELLRKDREQMHDTLKKQISGEVMDREVMRQLVTDHRKAMKPLIDLAIDRIAEFHAGLTPEQRDKLLAKLEKFEKHHQCFKE